jgi:hypothetical protein
MKRGNPFLLHFTSTALRHGTCLISSLPRLELRPMAELWYWKVGSEEKALLIQNIRPQLPLAVFALGLETANMEVKGRIQSLAVEIHGHKPTRCWRFHVPDISLTATTLGIHTTAVVHLSGHSPLRHTVARALRPW